MRAKASELRLKLAQLKSTRTPLEPLYRKLQRYILPETGHFENTHALDDSETGYEYINDATATDAIDVLGAGMLGGMTSPARPWFRLTTRSPELDENVAVKRWLSELQTEMQMVFAKSNVYQALNNAYLELACYGTACLVALPSDRHVIHLHEMTCGEYWIEEDSEGRVDTVYRQIIMTAKQMVEVFGEDAVSDAIRRQAKDPAKCFQEHIVIHAIEPRPDYDRTKKDKYSMPYRGVYFEETPGSYGDGPVAGMEGEANTDRDRVLLEEGFKSFPCLVPRWSMSKRTPYGRSPGMKALGVVMALQEETVIKERGTDYTVNPPLLVPSTYEDKPLDFGPGGISYCDLSAAQQVKTAWDVRLDLNAVKVDIDDKRTSINNYFYKDLFLMLAQTARYGRTAYEVEKLDKEKMLIMGPVLERLHLELLDPLIAATLQCMDRFGLIPDMPDEIKSLDSIFGEREYIEGGTDPETGEKRSASDYINIEYVSILAQAQRAAGVDAMSTYVQSLAGAAQAWPNVIDMLDEDKWARKLADQLGVDPELVPSSEEVQEKRDARAQQQQASQQLQAAEQMANIAKNIPSASSAQTMQQMSGYAGM